MKRILSYVWWYFNWYAIIFTFLIIVRYTALADKKIHLEDFIIAGLLAIVSMYSQIRAARKRENETTKGESWKD